MAINGVYLFIYLFIFCVCVCVHVCMCMCVPAHVGLCFDKPAAFQTKAECEDDQARLTKHYHFRYLYHHYKDQENSQAGDEGGEEPDLVCCEVEERPEQPCLVQVSIKRT